MLPGLGAPEVGEEPPEESAGRWPFVPGPPPLRPGITFTLVGLLLPETDADG